MQTKFYYANGVEVEAYSTPFYSVDSEMNYTENKQNNQSELDAHGWGELDNGEYPYNPEKPDLLDSVKLEYRFNSHGFRGIEFPTTKTPRSIITLGCNNTVGIGMPEGLIWPTLIANTLKIRAINLAVENTSLDTQYRLLLAWLPKIQSKYVFCLEPIDDNYEVSIDGFYKSERYPNEQQEFYIVNRDKNIRAMESLCDQFEAQFIFLPRTVWEYNESNDFARDLLNPGRKSHIYITYQMLKKAGYYE